VIRRQVFGSNRRRREWGGAGILGKDGSELGELAEEELGTFAGFDEAGVPAIGAEAKSGDWRRALFSGAVITYLNQP